MSNGKNILVGNYSSDPSKKTVEAISQHVGAFGDYVNVPFVPNGQSLMAFLATAYYHVHGANFILPDDAPVTITSGDIGVLGSVVEVIGVGEIKHDFDLHWTSVSDISTTLQGMLYFYGRMSDDDEWELIGPACDVVRTTAQSREIQSPAMVLQQERGKAIGMAFKCNSAGATVKVRLYGHVYATTLD